jgi:hypothetical protein
MCRYGPCGHRPGCAGYIIYSYVQFVNHREAGNETISGVEEFENPTRSAVEVRCYSVLYIWMAPD